MKFMNPLCIEINIYFVIISIFKEFLSSTYFSHRKLYHWLNLEITDYICIFQSSRKPIWIDLNNSTKHMLSRSTPIVLLYMNKLFHCAWLRSQSKCAPLVKLTMPWILYTHRSVPRGRRRRRQILVNFFFFFFFGSKISNLEHGIKGLR